MEPLRRRPRDLDALADEIAYAARYGMQQFPWMALYPSRLASFNRAIVRIVKAENTPRKDDDEE